VNPLDVWLSSFELSMSEATSGTRAIIDTKKYSLIRCPIKTSGTAWLHTRTGDLTKWSLCGCKHKSA